MSMPWSIPETPSAHLSHERKAFWFALAFSFVISVAAHAQAIEGWMRTDLILNQEFIQGTHDSYHWLAGAKGVGSAVGTPLAVMASWFSTISGFPIGMAGFFLPPLFAGFVAVAMCWWCRVLGWREGAWAGGVVAGVLTVLGPGFFFRTRLGYYDTDMVTLLFPLLMALGLAVIMAPWTKPTWLSKEPAPEPTATQWSKLFIWMTLLGLFGRFGALWHGHVLTFVKVLCVVGAIWVLAAGRQGARGTLLVGIAVFMASALLGWIGLAVALGIAAAAWFAFEKVQVLWKTPWPALGILLLLALAGGVGETAYENLKTFYGAYVKPQEDVTVESEGDVIYPGIGQSVIEAQNIPLGQVLERFHSTAAIAGIGVVCFLGVLILRPGALLLLPFLIMGLAAVKLGSRLTMFGGAPVSLGLGMLIGWAATFLFQKGGWAAYKKLGLALVAMVLLSLPMLRLYVSLPPTPVLSKAHCRALETLKKSPEESIVWTWWDWGYATHYYAERISFADGGRHYGHHVFTLGLAMTTPNPRLANQLIKYSAQHDDEPWNVWNTMSRVEVEALLQRLGTEPQDLPLDAPRYVVATYENLRLAPWITYYGTWNMARKQGRRGQLLAVREPFSINWNKGQMEFTGNARPIPMDTIDIISKKGRRGGAFPDAGGAHLIINDDVKHFFIVDDQIYHSMLVQLLLEDPEAPKYEDYFKLVYDDFPNVRIFEVQ